MNTPTQLLIRSWVGCAPEWFREAYLNEAGVQEAVKRGAMENLDHEAMMWRVMERLLFQKNKAEALARTIAKNQERVTYTIGPGENWPSDNLEEL